MNEHITVRNPLAAKSMGSSNGDAVLLGYTKRTTGDTIEDEIEDNFDPSLVINSSDSVSQVCSNAQSPRQQRYQQNLSTVRSNYSRDPQSTVNLQPEMTIDELINKSVETQSKKTQLEWNDQHQQLKTESEAMKEMFIFQKHELSASKQEIDRLRKKQDEQKTKHKLDIESLKYSNKQEADCFKHEYKQELEFLRTQHEKEILKHEDALCKYKEKSSVRLKELKQQNEELTEYRSLTVLQTLQRKLDDSKLLGLSAGVEVAPKPKIFIKAKQTPDGRNQFLDRL